MKLTRSARTYARIGVLILFGVILATYAAIQAAPLIEGPEVAFASPVPGATYRSPFLAVVGTARNVSYLSLNGRQIYIDERGIWSEKLLLTRGYTILELVGTDRFGRQARARVPVIY